MNLVCDGDGVKDGCHLHVYRPQEFAPRADGGLFDHMPMKLRLPINARREGPDKDPDEEHASSPSRSAEFLTSFKWSDELQDKYVDIICNDAEIKGMFDRMYECADVVEMECAFRNAVIGAMDKASVKRVSGQRKYDCNDGCARGSHPRNAWYGKECKEARAVYRQALRVHCHGSHEAVDAFKRYHRVCRRHKRDWQRNRSACIRHELCLAPKLFWKRYAGQNGDQGSFTIDQWSQYFAKLLGSSPKERVGACGCEDVPSSFPVPDESVRQKAVTLNAPITRAEVEHVLHVSQCGKAHGVDGIPVEFMKRAVRNVRVGDVTMKEYVLAEHLTHLFNHVLTHGYPSQWAVGVVVPVPKPKGNPQCMDDYRGITVGSALSKMYSMVLLHRLDDWAEKNGLRACGQAGFRKGRGTVDNSVILQHIINKHKKMGKAVYTAFVDFRKAYDCVRREVLWECLKSLGLHGHILESIMGMYTDVKLRVKTKGSLGEPFPSMLGVKQGDPLSPLLFGLLIDRFEQLIERVLPDVGVHVKDRVIRVLLYADDLVLTALSASDLQKMINVLHMFCLQSRMTVNIKKSEIVVFNSRYCGRGGRVHMSYDDQVLPLKSEFVYLGTLFSDSQGTCDAATRCLSKGRAAMYAMVRRCEALGLHNVHVRCRLFDSLVVPILLFGAEIWGPCALLRCIMTRSSSGILHEMECLHKNFLVQCLGLSKMVPSLILMKETCRWPLWIRVLKHVVRFWNRAQARDEGDLVKITMMEGHDIYTSGQSQGSAWVSDFMRCLGKLDVPIGANMQVNEAAVIERAQNMWLSRQGCAQAVQCVRDIPDNVHQNIKAITYLSWFASDVDVKCRFWYNLDVANQIKVVARFCMGCSWLNIEAGRWQRIPRSERVCQCTTCVGQGVREDEAHILECPLYNNLLTKYHLMRVNGDARTNIEDRFRCLMSPPGDYVGRYWGRIAGFLMHAKKLRKLDMELNM